jgi:hypothetical protein
MSRSRKKPIIKDSRRGSSRLARRTAHKTMRHHTRLRILREDYEAVPVDEAEFVNDWDICDYRYDLRWESPEDEWMEKAARK